MPEIAALNETVELKIGDKSYELPVITGSEDEKGIDTSKLRGQTGHVTLDVGYKNTGSTTSKITFIDGEKGILQHCGYPIEQLAEHADFLEVIYLVLNDTQIDNAFDPFREQQVVSKITFVKQF